MKTFGSAMVSLCLLLMCIGISPVRAELNASVDRQQVAMGDTLRLTLTATADEDLNAIALEPLATDFNIVQRSTSSSTTVINGQTNSSRQLILDIKPRREGSLKVPALRAGNSSSSPLLVAVGPAPKATDPGNTVIFEAELDRDSVYVQGQLLLTLRVQQSINLEARSITELQLDDAFVVPLEQKSFQRTVGGRPWLVHEIRYAVFPETSGELVIPAQTFSARESQPRRSLFDRNSGRPISRSSEALRIEVLPAPGSFPAGATWLPARALTLEENWSSPPEQLQVGESVTRSVRIAGEGLQGAQLPPVLFPATDGLKYYPDQPVIEDSELGSGLQGSRLDSAALVPTRAGQWQIPELKIPWWDTQSGKVRYAVLPGRTVTVAAAAAGSSASPAPIASDPGTIPIATVPAAEPAATSYWWQVIAALAVLGWLLTGGYALKLKRAAAVTAAADTHSAARQSERQAYRQLLAACASDSAPQARRALLAWATATFPQQAPGSTGAVLALFPDAELERQLGLLDAHLYRAGDSAWDGSALADVIKRLRRSAGAPADSAGPALQLYPDPA